MRDLPASPMVGHMWKRVHLATIDGPDPGHAIELGAAGRGLPPGDVVAVGRGEFTDFQIIDPHLSREHFTARAGTCAWGRAGVWVEEGGRRRHLRPGARFRAGSTTFEARTDTSPPHEGGHGLTRMLVRALPLAVSVGFVAMWLIPGAGPWPLVAAALLTPAGMLLGNRVQRERLPDPAALRRRNHGPRATDGAGEHPWRVDVGNATAGLRFRPGRLALSPGDVLGLAGEGAPGLARWVCAQLVSYGGDAASAEEAGGQRFTVTLPGEREVTILAAPSPALLPGHVVMTCPVGGGHNRDVSAQWYESFVAHSTGVELPHAAHLREHLPDLGALGAGWNSCDSRLSAPIGVTAGQSAPRPIAVDLAGDSPHAIIAGTTGAGKSELLTSWLCGLATRYPPAHVALVLIDYKGGATFGPLTRLPHVIEVLTDLGHSTTVRALASLRVEIHRRETLLKESGAVNLVEYNAHASEPLARLLIAVDEFRVLADEYPDVLDQLVRVAAQGRSLGIHVILATQRPGGTMTPDIRANMGLRMCLRVVEETDSIDLLGVNDAARLPGVPGRMILRDEELHTVQTLWAGGSLDLIVSACLRAAAQHPHLAALHRPWAPPLPSPLHELPPPSAEHIAIGVSDLPEEQRLGTWQIPTDAHLTVCGEAGSGRTNAARLLTAGALRAGMGVHVISSAALTGGVDAGTVAPIDDPVTCHALLTRIGRTPGPDALIIDDAELLVDTLDGALGAGEGLPFLRETLRACRHHGRLTVVTTALPAPTWAQGGERIVFLPSDPHLGAIAGLSTRFSRPGPPGRAVAIRGGRETLIQVAHAPENPLGPFTLTTVPVPEFRIRPLPTSVDLPLTSTTGICIGVGGENHQPVNLPCEAGEITLVVAPAGAGKTRLTKIIAARAVALGRKEEIRIVDDLHTLDTSDLDSCHEALRAGQHLVVTTTPEGLAGGYHPLITRLRHAEHTVYISLIPRAVIGINLGVYITPNTPGRAVIASRGRFTPVQLDACSQLP